MISVPILWKIILLSFTDLGSSKLLSQTYEIALELILYVTVAAYNFSCIFLHCTDKKTDFNVAVCMTTYAYYLYMHLYPMQSMWLPAVIYI